MRYPQNLNSYKIFKYGDHKHVQSKYSYLSTSCVLGNLSLEKSKRKKPCDWLPDQSWEDIVKLAELFPEQFGSLPDDLEKNSTDWKTVSHHSDKNHYRNLNVSVESLTLILFLISGTTSTDQNRLHSP